MHVVGIKQIIERALVSYSGVTTSDGGAGGSTLVDSNLSIDYDGQTVLITSGSYTGQARDIDGDTSSGTVTPSSNFGGVIVEGTTFLILSGIPAMAEFDDIKGSGWTNENLTTIDALIDAILADTGTDGVVVNTFTATGKGEINAEVDTALNTAIPASPTADSINERVKAIDLLTESGGGGDLAAIKTQTDKIASKMLFSMDFWSDLQEEVQLTSTASDEGLPSVDVADLPTNATIVRAVAMFKFRMIENIHETEANNLVLDQYIQVKKTGQAFNNAIKMINLGFAIVAATREGGDVIIGNLDLAGENKVDADATYECQWTTADAAQDSLNFNDVQMGIRIWYKL